MKLVLRYDTASEFAGNANSVYEIIGFTKVLNDALFTDFKVNEELELSWQGGNCDILRAVNVSPIKDSFSYKQCCKSKGLLYLDVMQAKNIHAPFKELKELQRM